MSETKSTSSLESTTETIRVFVNDEARKIPETSTVADLLLQLQMHSRTGLAIAVNNHVVPKSERQNTKLLPNDSIIIFTAAQGG